MFFSVRLISSIVLSQLILHSTIVQSGLQVRTGAFHVLRGSRTCRMATCWPADTDKF
jgi:hypothetical protein